MENKNRKKIGLALGSGGVKGIAHVGVIKSLLKHSIPIDYISGTSIGALIAVHYALFQDLEKLENIILEGKREKIVTLLEPTFRGGIIKGRKTENLLNKWLDGAEFSDLKIPAKIVATDLVSGEQVVFSEGKVVPAIRASMAVPTIFAPAVIEGRILVDGGISNPVPDDLLKGMGADVIVSVNLDNYRRNSSYDSSDVTLIKTARRSLDILRLNLAKYSINHSDVIIEPHITFIGIKGWTKYFIKDLGPQIREMGEIETDKYIDNIKDMIRE